MRVVVGIIKNNNNEILISKRRLDQYKGGFWEFPGGKIENDENVFQALQRELNEELGIHVVSAESFMQLGYDYIDRQVLLNVWIIHRYNGDPKNNEKQLIRWVLIRDLSNYSFPEGNTRIIQRLNFEDTIE